MRALLLFSTLLAACAASPRPGDPLPRTGDEISVCGQLFHTGTPVVLWNDPGGYDAYRLEHRFPEELPASAQSQPVLLKPRYHSFRGGLGEELGGRVRSQGWSLADLQRKVDQFVVHYDVCGTSRQCFKILHDRRTLSVHFLLDVDGTIYQTLDLKERAWHASIANDRSVGIEIAQIGAYSAQERKTLDQWYEHDGEGPKVKFPAWMKTTGIRTPGFVARPARRELLDGPIHGARYWQYDFTEAQYQALARLLATLHRTLPGIRLDAPRGTDGKVTTRALTDEEFRAFRGVLGHYHVTSGKSDPGPAFDWERVLREAAAPANR